MKKKILAAALSLVMVLGLTAIPSGQAATAKAAGNKGAVIVNDFAETTWETDWEDMVKSNVVRVNVWGTDNVTLSENLTISYDLYVSKGLFDAENDAINVMSGIGVMQGEDYDWLGALCGIGNMDFILNDDGSFHFSQWDETQKKDIDVTSGVSMEEKGDYYVFTVKDYSVGVNLDDEARTKLDLTKQYNIEGKVEVTGVNSITGEGVIIVDNIKVMDGDKELISQDFESGKKCGNIYKSGVDDDNWPEISGTSYDTSVLSLKKNKADIKVGKKVKIKASAVSSAKVTYKSNKPKVATVDKNGKVKGLKKGTAIISVTSCGKTLKYKVKVK